MIYQILLLLSAAALLFALGLVLYTAFVCRRARINFIKTTRGLPMLPEMRLMGNGAVSWVLRPNLCVDLAKMHEKMGKTMGWLYNTTPGAVTVDLDLIKRIQDEPNKHTNRIKTLNLPLEEFDKSIMLVENEEWRRVRRHFAPALKSNKFKTPNVMSEIEGSIEKLIGLIDAKLDDQSKMARKATDGRLINMDDLVHRYTINLVFSCLYKQPELVNFDERPCHWVSMVDEGLEAMQTSYFVKASMVFPILTRFIDWLIWHFHSQGTWRQDIMRFVKRQTQLGFEARKEAQEMLAQGKEIDPENFVLRDGTKFKRNMIDHVIDAFLDGKLGKEEYFNTSCFLFNAADKTSADAITHALYQIAAHAEIQTRLRKSIQEEGVDSEYLSWVINESLRLMPPVTIGCSRTLAHDMQIENGRHVLPKGTFVITCSYAIHRLREYWGADADEFKPERWRDTSKHHPMQYLPFGYGPRGCPGKEFALYEMKLLLTTLLTRYTFETRLKEDLQDFASPGLIFLLAKTPTFITIKRLQS